MSTEPNYEIHRKRFEEEVFAERFIRSVQRVGAGCLTFQSVDCPTKAELCKRDAERQDDYANEHVSAMWFGFKLALKTCGEDAARFKAIVRACGHVENGTDSPVRLVQDDATREWLIRVGDGAFGRAAKIHHAKSAAGVVDELRKAQAAEGDDE